MTTTTSTTTIVIKPDPPLSGWVPGKGATPTSSVDAVGLKEREAEAEIASSLMEAEELAVAAIEAAIVLETDGVDEREGDIDVREEAAEAEEEADGDCVELGSEEGAADTLALLLMEGVAVIEAIGDGSATEGWGEALSDIGRGEVDAIDVGEGEGTVEGVVVAVTPEPQFSCST